MNDEWETPQQFFDTLDKEFHFTLDPCSTDKNCKCAKHYTIEDNGLLKLWRGERVFMNPPYSNIGAWTNKARLESQYELTFVVGILPAKTDTTWFHKDVWKKAEIQFIKSRLYFELNGNTVGRANFPSMVVIWR